MNNPLYSIITPVYNRAACIGRCIESVIANVRHTPNIEHIIVDDGSSDKTANIVKAYAEKYPHIHFIQFEKNKGTNAARNAAIAEAQGVWCIILDSDDCFVEDALKTIKNVVSTNSFREYMFAPNDMQSRYEKNRVLNGSMQKALTYKDFLSERISGDFIHVVSTDIMKKYPFDEQLRIYEGVFFMRFYRESKKILFTNKVVTIRERSRRDSVTRETFRTNKNVIRKNILATQMMLDWFRKDYESFNLNEILAYQLKSLIENNLLLSEYKQAKSYMEKLESLNFKKPAIYYFIYHLRIGWLFRCATKYYLLLKYNMLQSKLK